MGKGVKFQPSLFGWQVPKKKIPISAARIREAKEAIIRGDSKSAKEILMELNDKLENYERRIHTKPNDNESNL